MSERIFDLQQILANPSNEERRELLRVRGWQLQRAEAETDQERSFCDWMLNRECNESERIL